MMTAIVLGVLAIALTLVLGLNPVIEYAYALPLYMFVGLSILTSCYLLSVLLYFKELGKLKNASNDSWRPAVRPSDAPISRKAINRKTGL